MTHRRRSTSSLSPRGVMAAALILLTVACGGDRDPRAAEESNGTVASADTSVAPTAQAAVDWPAVDAAIGRPGAVQGGDVHRYNFPRGDLRVTVGDVTIRPALALGGWIAMKEAAGGVIAMGDLVLTDAELTPVITRLQEGGIDQTAIHHHLLHESPRVYYMHVHAHGEPIAMATTLRSAIALTAAPAPPSNPAPPPPLDPAALDTALLARTLGYTGRLNGGVYQVGVPRVETIRDGDFEIPPTMGLGTAINFQPTGGGKVAITGDFVMVASEVNAVIKALRAGGIEVTALHNHMLTESPRLFFMHFWAHDDAIALARTLRTALALTNSQKPSR